MSSLIRGDAQIQAAAAVTSRPARDGEQAGRLRRPVSLVARMRSSARAWAAVA
ncbi:hypothetical protein ACIBQX_26665 [Nonomuraea sp. NPDC049714]|uniref:hypothetical protein n=1 Tax=Nonomuraea sp. NPDC049714 TaxID=3364357 RepID=UPI0037890148